MRGGAEKIFQVQEFLIQDGEDLKSTCCTSSLPFPAPAPMPEQVRPRQDGGGTVEDEDRAEDHRRFAPLLHHHWPEAEDFRGYRPVDESH